MNNNNIIYKFEPLWEDWKILKPLDSGSSGFVYTMAKDDDPENLSIVKMLTIPNEEQNRIICEYFKNDKKEINQFYANSVNNILLTLKNISKLNGHSNIISLENFMVKKDEKKDIWYLFLKMEYATPLYDYIKKNAFTENDLICLGMGVCNAISAFHNSNIVHENIKESNIFISKNNTFKISDFNLLRDLQFNPMFDSTIIPPEIAEGKPFSKLSDIYSLGILLYKLCNNGNLPFIKDNQKLSVTGMQNSSALRLSGKDLPAPQNSSTALSKVILKACSYKPELRYKKIDDMKNDLKKILQLNDNPNNKLDFNQNSISSSNEINLNSSNGINKIFGNSQNTINYLPVDDNISNKKTPNKKFILISSSISAICLLIIFLFFISSKTNKSPLSSNHPTNTIIDSKKYPVKSETVTTKIPDSKASNLVKNPNIEDNDLIWLINNLRTEGICSLSNKIMYKGSKSLKVELIKTIEPGQYSEITYYQDIDIEKGKQYKLSLYMKTDEVSSNSNNLGDQGAFAMILYHDNNDEVKYSITPYVRSTTDWTYYETSVLIPPDSSSDKITIHVGICNEIGTAYFDNINFELIN
ncbi:MAG: protein kinase [Clostridiales bacterium]